MDKELLMERGSGRSRHVHSADPEFSIKAAACITHVKRTFILTFVFTFLAMAVMYSTSDNFRQLTVVTTIKSMGSGRVVTKQGLYWASSIQRPRNSSVSETVANTSSDVSVGITSNRVVLANGSKILVPGNVDSRTTIPGNVDLRTTIQGNVDLRTTIPGTVDLRKTIPGSVEFPGMPDPCAMPRRKTGVEDVLCMERPKFLPEYKNPCWMDQGRLRCLPYFHLFGICKSGTSDLFKRILLHPELVPNKGIFGKEIWYWSWKRFDLKNRGGLAKLGMTLKEFTDQFYPEKIQNNVDTNGTHPLITGHGDPMDFWDRFAEDKTPQNSPGAEELLWTTPYAIRHINPDVKLILMLRDPIDRLYSHYFHSGAGSSAQSFDEHIRYSIPLWKQCLEKHTVRSCIYNAALRKQLKAPIYTSFYSVHMKEWLKVFPRNQMFIFRNEDYTRDMSNTLKQLFAFLKVSIPGDAVLDRMVSLGHFYETQKKAAAGPMFAGTRQLLVELYKPYTTELAQLLGDDRFAFRDASFG